MIKLTIDNFTVEISSVKDVNGLDTDTESLRTLLAILANAFHDSAEYHENGGRHATARCQMDNVRGIWEVEDILDNK